MHTTGTNTETPKIWIIKDTDGDGLHGLYCQTCRDSFTAPDISMSTETAWALGIMDYPGIFDVSCDCCGKIIAKAESVPANREHKGAAFRLADPNRVVDCIQPTYRPEVSVAMLRLGLTQQFMNRNHIAMRHIYKFSVETLDDWFYAIISRPMMFIVCEYPLLPLSRHYTFRNLTDLAKVQYGDRALIQAILRDPERLNPDGLFT